MIAVLENTMSRMSMMLLLSVACGCSGQYILTVPEQVVPVGGQVVMVARMQQEEFTGYRPAVRDIALQCRVANGPLRCAYTDRLGYAAAALPAPPAPGRYHVTVTHIDKDGREVTTFTPLYVWDKDAPVVAVDLDAFLTRSSPQGAKGDAAKSVRKALAIIQRRANIVYMTQRPIREHAFLHDGLASGEFPDGPILSWQREFFENRHKTTTGALDIFAVEDRLVSQLPGLKKTFPNLRMGITDSPVAARSMLAEGLKVVYVGQEGPLSPKVSPEVRRSSWSELAADGSGDAATETTAGNEAIRQ